MIFDNNQRAFFELVRAGLWEQDAQLSAFGDIIMSEVYRLAQEQSVVGLVAAGLEHMTGVTVSREDVLLFVSSALRLEQRNQAMNSFLESLICKMRSAGIYTLLIKGQGIAQCYERPLWRASGDVDLFLSEDCYEKARALLSPWASIVEAEDPYIKHIGMTIGEWDVELHGNLRSGISAKTDKMLDLVKYDVFYSGNVRSWQNGQTRVFLMEAGNDVVYVFSHILHHFFHGGIGLRQVCDWCRLLWKYRDSIKRDSLENRIRMMGLLSEWKTFAALAVDYLGMPAEAMPMYSNVKKWGIKANKVLSIVIETGNMGHNRDMSYRRETSAIKRKWETFYHISADAIKHFTIFPKDSFVVWCRMMKIGIQGLVCKN